VKTGTDADHGSQPVHAETRYRRSFWQGTTDLHRHSAHREDCVDQRRRGHHSEDQAGHLHRQQKGRI